MQVKRKVRPLLEDKVGTAMVKGELTFWYVDEQTGLWTPQVTQPNLIMIPWGAVAARTFKGDTGYLPSKMYIEWKNVAAPGDTVTAPSFARTDDLSYYTGLPADQDFMRISLAATPSMSVLAGYESYFGDGNGNKLTFIGQTSGTIGELGRTFANGSNSKVFGAAIVAAPDPDDRSKDLLFARSYIDASFQLLKLTNSQIAVTWNISFI